MTLNRVKNLRRLCFILAGLALGLMIFSKVFVVVASCPGPNPLAGYFGIQLTNNQVSFFRVPAAVGLVDLPRGQIQRSRVYYDPANIAARSIFDPYPRLVIPLWVPLVLAGLPYFFLNWRMLVLARFSRCQQCNYDLRRNVSGRCPECGAEIIPQSD